MTRQKAINIINNYDGVFALQFHTRWVYDEIHISSLTQVTDTLKAVVTSKQWYDDGEFGLVRYKLLGEIVVV